MKHWKKLLVVAAAVVMAMAMAVPAFAADTHTITLNSNDTHTYKIFQVLTGTMANEGDQNLGNPAWGADATDAAKAGSVADFIASLEGKTDEQVAAAVAAVVNTSADGQGTVDKDNPKSGLATGYYVLVDVTTLTGDFANDTKALHVVQVVNDINGLEIKWDTTSDQKTIVSDTLGADAAENEVNGSTDNVSVGDTVNYKIEAAVPEKASNYNYFYFVINDTLSDGLSFTDGSIKVYKDSISNDNLLAETTDYVVKTTGIDETFEVGLVNAKALAGKTIIVTYSATLNENAEIGGTPNTNTSTVTFSNDPNHNYDGTNNPTFPSQTDKTATGKTPESKTETYTTGIEIQKVDENGNVLTGAEFTITGDSTEIVLVSSETFEEAIAADGGEYYKLKNETYTKEAPITADYMEAAAAGATKGYVVDNDYTGEDKVVIGETTYRPYAPATDEGKTVYTLVRANADQYDSVDKLYKKTVSYTQKDTTSSAEAKAVVGDDGVVSFVGLGAGTYTISETKTPAGYNTIADKTLTIAFNANGTPKWSKTSGDAAYDAADGVFKMTIENNKGTELPSTGGMGTTILYVIGAILVIGAGVYLITKRRAAKESNVEMTEEK